MDKTNKMLIDATHPEETRVVVLKDGRVEEFDFESATRRPLRGNIYLARVTRVEPSLQAAFVEYGGNRHGFLAFSEIHPDYYQIPVADRQALLQAEAEAEAEEEAEAEAREERRRSGHRRRGRGRDRGDWQDEGRESAGGGEQRAADTGDVPVSDEGASSVPQSAAMRAVAAIAAQQDYRRTDDDSARDEPAEARSGDDNVEEIGGDNGNGSDAEQVEEVGNDDALEELPERPRRRMRQYKIQEVVKRRQVILVQVVKEERGNKGAALTTYLSLAGRYTVLMPNTGRGGGISRKITNAQDRKRLKEIATELEVQEGMGLIVRTAGASRTKQEIKRDYEYLLRLWESVREMALNSNAPALVYEEGNLIKRSIRDLYSKDVEEIVVAGEAAFNEARDFMRMLMPSHVRHVVAYQEREPLFARFHIERQLNAMFSPQVTLRSGGYIVINQTEALVAIDVNSGRSTREFSIEETALNTNLEAAEEVARQLKLRDLAGLIVIDFIDMEEKRNNRAVERRMKDALRHDRARIQVGRISHFGLLEMSRQRLRTSVLEGTTSQCPHCLGTGVVRSTESVALAVLRGIEDHLMRDPRSSIVANTTSPVAIYLLNQKRGFITELEQRFGITINISASDRVQGAAFTLEKVAGEAAPQVRRPDRGAVNMDWGFTDDQAEHVEAAPVAEDAGEDRSESERRPRRRRRRGRRGDGEHAAGPTHGAGYDDVEPIGLGDQPEVYRADEPPMTVRREAPVDDLDAAPAGPAIDGDEGEAGGEERRERRGRRRGRRGGRGRREQHGQEQQRQPEGRDETGYASEGNGHAAHDGERPEEGRSSEPYYPAPEPARRHREPHREVPVTHDAAPQMEPERRQPAVRESARQPVEQATPPPAPTPEPITVQHVVPAHSEPVAPPPPAVEEPAGPPKRGWWQRKILG